MTNETTKSIAQYMGQPNVQENITNVLKDRAPQFTASVAALTSSNPLIAACNPKSVLSSCMIAASLDLPINQNLGFAYIIPYNVKVKELGIDGKEVVRYEQQAQFQMGWKGFVQLAIRSKQYKTINTRDVREGELIEEDFLSGEIKFQWAENRATLPVIGYVGFFRLVSGFEKMLYMSMDELKKHGAKYSKSFAKGYGQWADDFDAMAKKTVIKLLLSKYGIMTIDLGKAIQSDQAVIEEGATAYPDNGKPDAHEIAKEKERARIAKHIEQATTIEDLQLCEVAVQEYDTALQTKYDNKYDAILKGQI